MQPDEAAAWMLEELQRKKYLDQETVAWHLSRQNKSLVYTNENGNLGIAKPILAAFRKLLPDDVVWSRSDRQWRYRAKYDKPGRMQD